MERDTCRAWTVLAGSEALVRAAESNGRRLASFCDRLGSPVRTSGAWRLQGFPRARRSLRLNNQWISLRPLPRNAGQGRGVSARLALPWAARLQQSCRRSPSCAPAGRSYTRRQRQHGARNLPSDRKRARHNWINYGKPASARIASGPSFRAIWPHDHARAGTRAHVLPRNDRGSRNVLRKSSVLLGCRCSLCRSREAEQGQCGGGAETSSRALLWRVPCCSGIRRCGAEPGPAGQGRDRYFQASAFGGTEGTARRLTDGGGSASLRWRRLLASGRRTHEGRAVYPLSRSCSCLR